MRKLFILFVAFFAATTLWAQTFQSGDLYYKVTSETTVEIAPASAVYANLTSVEIPSTVTYDSKTYNVTSIGNSAFQGCSKLTSITLPNSVTTIGYSAFSGCSSLASLTIPKSVTSIDVTNQGILFGCNAMQSLIVEEGNPIYDSRDNCNAIIETATNTLIVGRKITVIPNSITALGRSAFCGCHDMSFINIPENVVSIGDYALSYCSELNAITLHDGITNIGQGAFANCIAATSINIPDGITSIKNETFNSCESLSSITIPNSVMSIGNNAFNSCSKLTSIIIPENVTSIGYSAFSFCSSLNTVIVEATTPPTLGSSVFNYSEPTCHIPFGTLEAYEASAWANQVGSFVEGEAPENHKIYYTTSDNQVIPSMNIYGSQRFGSNVYRNTYEDGVGTLVFKTPITELTEEGFLDCTNLTSVTLPEGVTTIRATYFKGCSALTSITIPKTVTNILGEWYDATNRSLTGCTSLASIIVEEGNNVFDSRNNSNALIETETNTLLWGCKNSTIPEGIITIGERAFSDCDITSVTIPNSVTSIGISAFFSTNITSIDIPNNVIELGHQAFNGCHDLITATIGDGIKNIQNNTFGSCTSLTTVTLGNNVESIGYMAFETCSKLNSIALPEGLKTIGEQAFYNCSSLTSITCKAETPATLGNSAFDGVSNSISVYVPCGCAKAYTSASGWNSFTNIQEPAVEYTIGVDVNDASMGTAQVEQNDCSGATISATANEGYHFVQWSDGNTDNPRTLTITADTELTAEFAADKVETEQYIREVTQNTYGTICIPFGSNDFSGATFFEIAYKAPLQIYFDEVTTLEAGKPYIYYAHSNQIVINSNGTKVDNPLSNINGLYGVFTEIAAAVGNLLTGNYIINSNMLRLCGDNCSLPANRAYVILKDVPETARPLAPGRQRVGMSLQDENTTTALDNITEDIQSNGVQEGTFDVLGRRLLQPTGSGFYIINGKKVIITK